MTSRPFGLIYKRPTTEKRTARIHKAIQDFIDLHGYPPGYRDIMDLAGISSTSVVGKHLVRLQRAGKIRFDSHVSRSIVLLKRIEVPE
jgi:SOS-response transcriptional repressor LexA